MKPKNFWRHVRKSKKCWIWTGCLWSNGYGRVRANGRAVVAHRVAYELAAGRIPSGKLVLHRCDVRACVNPRHLFLGTHADNVHDCMDKGRRAKLIGEQHPMSKLTEQQVREIRRSRKAGVTLSALASRYGVTPQAVCLAANNHSWSHL